MARIAKKVSHIHGIKSLGISCVHFNMVVDAIAKLEKRGAKTSEGFRIRVNIGDFVEAAIDEFIKKHKL